MADQEYPSDFPGDQTQPTAEILKALNNLKSEPPPEVPTPTEYGALTAQAKEKPHNPETWRRLIDVAENTGEIEKIRAAFDALLQQYPNTVCDTRVSLVPSLIIFSVFGTNCVHQSFSQRLVNVRRSRRPVQKIPENFALSRLVEVLLDLCSVRFICSNIL